MPQRVCDHHFLMHVQPFAARLFHVDRCSRVMLKTGKPSLALCIIRATYLHASPMYLSSCVTRQVCTYLEDLRPLSCAARGYVTTEDWRGQAERLLPGAARSLPGGPKFQVRALLGKAALERIGPTEITSCAGGCTARLLGAAARSRHVMARCEKSCLAGQLPFSQR